MGYANKQCLTLTGKLDFYISGIIIRYHSKQKVYIYISMPLQYFR